jgi:hypothetical protein
LNSDFEIVLRYQNTDVIEDEKNIIKDDKNKIKESSITASKI